MNFYNNQAVHMTRRHPNLRPKVLKRDSIIAKKIIEAWDIEQNPKKVLDLFIDNQRSLSDERYWEILRSVWVISGGLSNIETFKSLMLSNRKNRHYFSTPEDASELRNMPDEFVVYRAGHQNDGGISWTTSEEYANWYLKAYHKDEVVSRKVRRSEVFAYIARNLESEIIILN